MNHFPAWKNIMIAITLVIASIYALPNIYGEDPSVQISPLRGAVINSSLVNKVKKKLSENNLTPLKDELTDAQVLLRFSHTTDQLKAAEIERASCRERV